MNNEFISFPVTVYGNFEAYNDVISKGRLRIFYRGLNRNGSYITDEFADALMKTVSYTPVKGIYDVDGEDYTDHGQERSEGRIYGVVPENPNFAWEKHLDSDGVEREYACVDVLIYTALYKEASQIEGKSQSMELYPPSIKGDWETVDGQRCYVFKEGCFLGLQVLGDDTEPCFEGAAFFGLYKSFKDWMDMLNQYSQNFQHKEQGGHTMPTISFQMSDNQKFDALWRLLNPKYNEEGGWACDYSICEVYDSYAVARKHADGSFERVYYTKNDETNEVTIDSREECFIIDVNADEYAVLMALKKRCANSTYVDLQSMLDDSEAKIGELSTKIDELTTQNSTLSTQNEESTQTIATLNMEKGNISAELDAAKASLSTLQGQVDELSSFKAATLKREKEDIIARYTALLPADAIAKFTETMDQYDARMLDMELTYALKLVNPAAFSANPPARIPQESGEDGIEAILAKYKK